MKNHQKILINALVLTGLMVTNLVQAGFATGPIVPCTDNCTLCDLWHLASNIINFLTFNLSIPLASLLLVIAGFIFLISGGSQEKVSLAKRILTNTIIGLAIIFCSWLLIDTLFKSLATGAFSGAWNKFPTCP